MHDDPGRALFIDEANTAQNKLPSKPHFSCPKCSLRLRLLTAILLPLRCSSVTDNSSQHANTLKSLKLARMPSHLTCFSCTHQVFVLKRLLDNCDPPMEVPVTQEEFAAGLMAEIGHDSTDDFTIGIVPNSMICKLPCRSRSPTRFSTLRTGTTQPFMCSQATWAVLLTCNSPSRKTMPSLEPSPGLWEREQILEIGEADDRRQNRHHSSTAAQCTQTERTDDRSAQANSPNVRLQTVRCSYDRTTADRRNSNPSLSQTFCRRLQSIVCCHIPARQLS